MKRLLSAAVVVLWAGSAFAHSWYTGKTNPATNLGCCGLNDCGPIRHEAVKPVAGGYQITLVPGDHPMVTKPHVFTVPQSEVQFSPDGEFHICLYPTENNLRCVFVPAMGS